MDPWNPEMNPILINASYFRNTTSTKVRNEAHRHTEETITNLSGQVNGRQPASHPSSLDNTASNMKLQH